MSDLLSEFQAEARAAMAAKQQLEADLAVAREQLEALQVRGGGASRDQGEGLMARVGGQWCA